MGRKRRPKERFCSDCGVRPVREDGSIHHAQLCPLDPALKCWCGYLKAATAIACCEPHEPCAPKGTP